MKLNAFKRLKLVLFDFDDTLAVHEGHLSCSKLIYLTCIHSDNADPWKGTKKNVQLEKIMNLCVKNNIEIGLISATTSYTAGKRKEEWVLDNYGIACENFCVGDSEQKIIEMQALANARGLDNSEIAIIDDYYKTVESAADARFVACTPLEIVNFINEMGI